MKEWFTAAEISDLNLPGLPATARGVAKTADRDGWGIRRDAAGTPLARKRQASGGGVEYHYTLFPTEAQAVLVHKQRKSEETDPIRASRAQLEAEIWRWFDAQPDKKKANSQKRVKALKSVAALRRGGLSKNVAVNHVAGDMKVSARSIYGWFDLVAGYDESNWLPVLCPRHCGRSDKSELNEEAWAFIKGDYLRLERPTFESCYRRLEAAAVEHGWTIPSERTLKRRVDDLPEALRVLARDGERALKALYPAQERDRSIFHALEAVNADGHRWDVFVRWPDGEVGRPVMTAIQDLYSGMMLAWRIGRSENRDAFRLCVGDVVETYGIPDHIWLDNGRNFASKWMTGGIENRFRFKIRDEEPTGILVTLGVEVHWTTPYSGQSKPIERAFKDFCDAIAKHPALAGAYTGNSPMAKPENYGNAAIPIDDFIKVVEQGIIEHNERPGRRTQTANGRSFAETFRASYADSIIRTAQPEQKRLWLLAAESVKAGRRDGAIKFMENRYWCADLHEHRGQSLIARFDPDFLHDGLHVYRLDGSYIGLAEVINAQGFADTEAARNHGRARRAYIKATKEALAAERKLSPDQVAAQLPDYEPTTLPAARLVQATFGRPVQETRAKTPEPEALTDSQRRIQDEIVIKMEERRTDADLATERYDRARRAEADLDAGTYVDPDTRDWLEGYKETPEYRARKRLEGAAQAAAS